MTGEMVQRLCHHTTLVRDCSWHPYEPHLTTVSWWVTGCIRWGRCGLSASGYAIRSRERGSSSEVSSVVGGHQPVVVRVHLGGMKMPLRCLWTSQKGHDEHDREQEGDRSEGLQSGWSQPASQPSVDLAWNINTRLAAACACAGTEASWSGS